MARRIVDEDACVPGELRIERLPETRGGIAEGGMKPDVEPRVAIAAGPNGNVV
jgi:hypothetical protein